MGLVKRHGGDDSNAKDHLRQSADVAADCRISAYGPATILAKELCRKGYWSKVGQYLRACEVLWKDDRLRQWQETIARQELPDFDLED